MNWVVNLHNRCWSGTSGTGRPGPATCAKTAACRLPSVHRLVKTCYCIDYLLPGTSVCSKMPDPDTDDDVKEEVVKEKKDYSGANKPRVSKSCTDAPRLAHLLAHSRLAHSRLAHSQARASRGSALAPKTRRPPQAQFGSRPTCASINAWSAPSYKSYSNAVCEAVFLESTLSCKTYANAVAKLH